ncbi:MAG: DUF1622 domain-containing protein [Sandaracinus sp.]
MLETVQAGLGTAIEWLRLGVELVGALVLATGVVLSLVRLVRGVVKDGGKDFTDVRLMLARYLVLALELQLASDILSSAVAPTWDRIGKLAAIAVIRTLLNYFLTREMREVHAHASRDASG